MSYCRWSSDDWKCDIYAYANVGGGYTIHVAGRRLITPLPSSKGVENNPKEWIKVYHEQMQLLKHAEYEDINLPYAGETFDEPTFEEFLERLLELKTLGYHIPNRLLLLGIHSFSPEEK